MKTDVRALAKAIAELCNEFPPDRAPELMAAAADRLQGRHRDLVLFRKLLSRMLRRYGPIEAEVEVPSAPTEAERATFKTALEKVFHRPVALTVRQNPSLIGGARLHVGDERLDASLRGALQRLPSLLS